MGFADLSSSEAVLAAIAECEQLGEDAFLSKHGFGQSRHVRLLHEGKTFPAKAVVGVAHGYQFPDEGPLTAAEFTSGDSTINKLGQMGFTAQSVADASTPELFVVRGGGDEEVVDYAVENDVVATGWSELGDLSLLDDQALEREMNDVYGHVGSETRSRWKGALRTFKEIEPGDWVVLPITSRGNFRPWVGAGRASLDPGLFYRFGLGGLVEFVCIDTSPRFRKDRLRRECS